MKLLFLSSSSWRFIATSLTMHRNAPLRPPPARWKSKKKLNHRTVRTPACISNVHSVFASSPKKEEERLPGSKNLFFYRRASPVRLPKFVASLTQVGVIGHETRKKKISVMMSLVPNAAAVDSKVLAAGRSKRPLTKHSQSAFWNQTLSRRWR